LKKLSQHPQLKPLREENKIRKISNHLQMTLTKEHQEIETGTNRETIGEQMKEMMEDQASPEELTDQPIEVVEINHREEREVTVEVEAEKAVGVNTMKGIMKMAVFHQMISSKIPEKTKVESEEIVAEEQEVAVVSEVTEVTEEIVETEVVIV